MEIKDIMRKAIIIEEDASLKDVVKKMVKENVNSILVVNKKWVLVWSVDIVTLVKTIVPEYIWHRDNSVSEFTTESMFDDFIDDNKAKKVKYFMLIDPKTVNIDSPVLTAAIITTEWRQTRIPVVDSENKPLWVITRHSIKKILANKLWLKY